MVKLWRWKCKLYDLLQYSSFLTCRNCTLFGHISKSKENSWNVHRLVKTVCVCQWSQNSTFPNGSKAPFADIPRLCPEKIAEFPPGIRVICGHTLKFVPPEEKVTKQRLHWLLDSSLNPLALLYLDGVTRLKGLLGSHPPQPWWGPWTPADSSRISAPGWGLSCSSQKTCL